MMMGSQRCLNLDWSLSESSQRPQAQTSQGELSLTRPPTTTTTKYYDRQKMRIQGPMIFSVSMETIREESADTTAIFSSK